MGVKSKIKNNKIIVRIINFIRRIFGKNKIKVSKGNSFKIDGLIKGANIVIQGKGNIVEIKNPISIIGLDIFINGNNNTIKIEKDCILNGLNAWVEDNGGELFIGKETMICGETHLAVIEGCKITIGEECMFSSGIRVVTGDSHSIINSEGKRINQSLSVCVGRHVWVGNNATILKGVTISPNSIIGTRAVVTKSFENEGVVIAGNPAKIVKENINWDKQRISVEDNYGR